jgi:hypothetical protein
MLFDKWVQSAILDYECSDNPDVFQTSSCNLDYRQGHLAWEPLRDYSSMTFARRHVTGHVSLRFLDQQPESADEDQTQCADVIVAHFDMIDHAGRSGL